MSSRIKVISFDLDGVLFDGKSATYPVAKAIGIEDQFLEVLQRTAEQDLSLEESIREGCKIWKGIPVSGELESIVETMPLMRGAEETISQLKDWGYKVGCISSGVSQYFMRPLTRRLSLDFAYSNELGENDGKHDGTVHYIMGGSQKAETASKYLESIGLSNLNLASVGDGENDIPIFQYSKLSIAFNPESELVNRAASLTIHSKDLRDILPHFIPKD